MEGNYIVYFGNEESGRVQVLRQGLYYCIHCRCRLTGSVVCRLEVSWDGRRESLGVLVPMDGGFGLDTRQPIKRFPAGKPKFTVVPRHDKPEAVFVPIIPEEPFAYIEKLKDGYLAKKDGRVGLLLPQKEQTI